MREFVMNSDFREALRHADAEPVVVCGDFNAPSHLDWINETA
ncbi:unnamed protein product [Anisakis simplex]|uniref:Endo/exonuclease/phosphatase domain-containing protein n=1 Tax=Anisakis simplex TaxID=6269 RepID=A0A0M3KKG8_ANISI|nr:unnamed protein product [Anisakis simplex]